MTSPLSKPRVLITGAAKRIGRVIAIELSRRGFEVAIHYNRSRENAEEVSRVCGGAPIFEADLSHVEEIRQLFKEVAERFGALDCLVNNAARFTRFNPLDVTEADWDFIHDVNLKATFFCCQEAAKLMLTRALAKAFAPQITVNSVAPGAIAFNDVDARVQAIIDETPMRRAGTAEEVADAVHFFLTAPTFITGQTLAVDGGLADR
jgi:3-oxoacyl-[acyl-carrier protein] reductase/pteridine reductase